MKRRSSNSRIAKVHRTYDVSETATLYGCHRNTVHNWLRNGLPAIDDHRPTLIHGTDLNAFHAARRAQGKRPCGPGMIYCAPCRTPQRPREGTVTIDRVASNLWTVRGECPNCGRRMSQRVGAVRRGQFGYEPAESATLVSAPLRDDANPSANCDLRNEGLTP